MKNIVLAILIIVFLAGFSFYSSTYKSQFLVNMQHEINELSAYVYSGNKTGALEKTELIEIYLDEHRSQYKIFANHNNLSDIEETFARIKGYITIENIEGYSLETFIMSELLMHLHTEERLSLENLF